jgi:cbb3-type cytochrome oxidase maturation protein
VSVIVILILASLAMALLFLGAFIWSVRSGQFEDTTTPSMRILSEDAIRPASAPKIKNQDQAGLGSTEGEFSTKSVWSATQINPEN